MSIVCISDLHLCDGGPRDNFAVRGVSRFHRFLDWVNYNNYQLYILGDMFEWWQCNLSKSVIHYAETLRKLRHMRKDARWIVGNHDGALASFIDHPEWVNIGGPPMSRYTTQLIYGRKFLFMHGHESDPYCNGDNPGTGEITAIISGMMEDRNRSPNHGGHAVEDEFIGTLEGALDLWRKLTLKSDRLGEMIDNVEKFRLQHECDVVVSGHTHSPGRIGTYHYNTGCWCRELDTAMLIHDNGIVQPFSWNGDTPESFDKELR